MGPKWVFPFTETPTGGLQQTGPEGGRLASAWEKSERVVCDWFISRTAFSLSVYLCVLRARLRRCPAGGRPHSPKQAIPAKSRHPLGLVCLGGWLAISAPCPPGARRPYRVVASPLFFVFFAPQPCKNWKISNPNFPLSLPKFPSHFPQFKHGRMWFVDV